MLVITNEKNKTSDLVKGTGHQLTVTPANPHLAIGQVAQFGTAAAQKYISAPDSFDQQYTCPTPHYKVYQTYLINV